MKRGNLCAEQGSIGDEFRRKTSAGARWSGALSILGKLLDSGGNAGTKEE
jgi:hypothetical protein